MLIVNCMLVGYVTVYTVPLAMVGATCQGRVIMQVQKDTKWSKSQRCGFVDNSEISGNPCTLIFSSAEVWWVQPPKSYRYS